MKIITIKGCFHCPYNKHAVRETPFGEYKSKWCHEAYKQNEPWINLAEYTRIEDGIHPNCPLENM